MAKRDHTKEPMYRITMVRGHLEMVEKVGVEPILSVGGYDSVEDLLAEASYAIQTLCDFRNIIFSMVDLKQEPKDAAARHLDDSA